MSAEVVVCFNMKFVVTETRYPDKRTYSIFCSSDDGHYISGVDGKWVFYHMSIYEYPRIDDLIAERERDDNTNDRDATNSYLEWEENRFMQIVSKSSFNISGGKYKPGCLVVTNPEIVAMKSAIRSRIRPFEG